MKEKDEELDKVFKKGTDDPVNEAVYRDTDWDAMEQLLDQRKKQGGVVYWLPRLGGVAAVLVLALLAWLFFRPQPTKTNNVNPIATVHSTPDTSKSGGAGQHKEADSSKQNITPANLAQQNSVHPGAGKKTDRSFPYQQDGHAAKLPGKEPAAGFASVNAAIKNDRKDIGHADVEKDNAANTLAANNTPVTGDRRDIGHADNKKDNDHTNKLTANAAVTTSDQKDIGHADVKRSNDNGSALTANTAVTTSDRKDIGHADTKSDNGNSLTATPKQNVKIAGTSNNANRPIFAITALASSDMNGTSPLNSGRLGENLGALFSVSSGKWTFSTGGMYSIKPYQETFAEYHTPYQFQANPASVGVNCRMIDIPLDVNYQVYRKGINKFTVGTGLSSYIILREDYTFNYPSPYAYGPAGYSVINRNRNIMSILNLDVTYERQINSRFGLVLQPYYKLPLTNVGASQVKLQSTGIAVGLNWNLNTFKKPN